MTTLPEWNLKDFYPSFESKLISEDMNDVKKMATSFSKKYKNKLNILNSSLLVKSLSEYEKLEEKIVSLKSFAFLTYCTDQLNKEKTKFFQKVQEYLSEVEKKTIFYTIELNKLKKNKSIFLEKSKYKSWILNLNKIKKYQKSETVETLLMEKSITSSSAWIKFFDQKMARLKFDFRKKKITETEILNLLSSTDKNVRKDAALSFGKTLKENIFDFTFVINNISKDLDIEKNLRGFKYSESSRHLSNQIDKKDVDSLVKIATKNYKNICHRYYKYKAKHFGTIKLNYWDRNAPYPKTKDRKINWNEAKKIVLDSYYGFDKKLGDIANIFFEKSWIHAKISRGKASGAFSHPTVPKCHPYILVNFQGKIRDVMTLAHELGHGIHQYLANKNGFLLSDTPLTLAETASVFGEMLTFRSLLKNSKDKDEKKFLLRNKIEDMINTVFRQIAFFIFERNIHNERMNGELSDDDISRIWMSSQNKSLGNCVKLNGDYKYFWAYIPHFIHSPFYVYAYAFGDCLVNSLYSKFEENIPNFNAKYIKLLESGGTKHYQQILKEFDLDPKQKDFWQMGMNLIQNLIDELEQLG